MLYTSYCQMSILYPDVLIFTQTTLNFSAAVTVCFFRQHRVSYFSPSGNLDFFSKRNASEHFKITLVATNHTNNYKVSKKTWSSYRMHLDLCRALRLPKIVLLSFRKINISKKLREDTVPLTFHTTSVNPAGQRLAVTTKGLVPLIFT